MAPRTLEQIESRFFSAVFGKEVVEKKVIFNYDGSDFCNKTPTFRWAVNYHLEQAAEALKLPVEKIQEMLDAGQKVEW